MIKGFEYIIVGGGLAGASAVEGIREHDREGSIALFGKEDQLPYDRPPLSKGLWLGKTKVEDLPVHDSAFYETQAVQLFLDTEATDIDPSKHQVVNTEGKRYAYGKLLIATGGVPRTLPFGSGALHYFRTLADYLWLKAEADRATEVIVIGGGFIGSELAAALSLNGKKVTMIFTDHSLLQRVLPPDLSSFVTEYYRSKGITVASDEMPIRAGRSNNRITVTTTSGKEFSADVAIAAVGLDLRLDMVKRAGLKADNGITVNEFLQSSDQDIYAAGDVAYFPAISLDKYIRIEHWNNAQVQGKHAGENMAGANKPFEYLPYFYSDLFDLGFEAVGELDSRKTTVAEWKEDFREGVVYYLDDGRVKGVLLWNVWEKVDAARRLINRKQIYADAHELKSALSTA
jgi:3-phenylpropionate/trans-cinnamate dioxygenase ferredoxin reductase subunit